MMASSPENDLLIQVRSALADRYDVIDEIGGGGMAVVFRAKDLQTPREVAIKVMRPWIAAALGPDRFLKEIEITAQLRHPNIVPVLNSGVADDLLYYAMPLVESETVRERLERTEEPLQLDEAVQLTREIADALQFAHDRGFIHRDIKPANIMLEAGHAVVADFGIARAISQVGGDELTEAGAVVGTPSYMSPEQAWGVGELDARSDVYSLACVTYEMLGGRSPVNAKTTQDVLAVHAKGEIPNITKTRPELPVELGAVLEKGLARDRDNRYGDAKSFIAELDRVTIPEKQVDLRQFAKRFRVPLTVIAIAVLGLVGWGGRRNLQIRWARESIAEIISLKNAGEMNAAFQLALRVEEILPNDPTLIAQFPDISRRIALRTTQPGAEFRYRPYLDVGGPWILAGVSKADGGSVRIPLGFFRWQVEVPGYAVVEAASDGVFFGIAAHDGTIPLHPIASTPPEAVYISGGRTDVPIPALAHLDSVDLANFWMDRFEVTNRQYKLFVDSGGYNDPKYWTVPFASGGDTLSWELAMSQFLDLTRRAGPAGWEFSDYPEGSDDHPVGGLSWYEAVAYAEFVGKQLPSVYHWGRVAGTDLAEHLLDLANFEETAKAVGTSGEVGPFGAYDMAGNVREWSWNADGEQRWALGGALGEPRYMFVEAAPRSAWDRDIRNGVRLISTIGDENLPADVFGAAEAIVTERQVTPIPQEVYEAYAGLYEYDPTDLEVVEEWSDSTEDWTRTRVTFRTAYGTGERMPAYLFLPKGADAPYQTVVYFPGSYALYSGTEHLVPGETEFLVKTGRAVLYPVFHGTYERYAGFSDDNPEETNSYRDHVIMLSKDLGRSIDYLATRGDVDANAIGYFGFSWGAAIAAVLLAHEPRIKAAVLVSGGYWNTPVLPAVDQRTFAPHVTTPVLMINGRYDQSTFRLEAAQRPMFDDLGTPLQDKRLDIHDTGHQVEKFQMIPSTLDWFDRYLGSIR